MTINRANIMCVHDLLLIVHYNVRPRTVDDLWDGLLVLVTLLFNILSNTSGLWIKTLSKLLLRT